MYIRTAFARTVDPLNNALCSLANELEPVPAAWVGILWHRRALLKVVLPLFHAAQVFGVPENRKDLATAQALLVLAGMARLASASFHKLPRAPSEPTCHLDDRCQFFFCAKRALPLLVLFKSSLSVRRVFACLTKAFSLLLLMLSSDMAIQIAMNAKHF